MPFDKLRTQQTGLLQQPTLSIRRLFKKIRMQGPEIPRSEAYWDVHRSDEG